MTSTEQAVNRMLADLSRIPTNINSTSRVRNSMDIDELARRISDKTMMELKSRGIA